MGLAGARSRRCASAGGERAAAAVVAEGQLLLALLRAQRLQPLGRAEAEVGGAARHQLVRVLPIDLGALALAVGTVGPADVRALVPGEAEPAQGLEDHPLAGGMAALAVGVLDAQEELAAQLAGEGVVERATYAVPTWGSPVGDGAMRVRTDISRDGLLARGGAADENVNYTTRRRPDWLVRTGGNRDGRAAAVRRRPRESSTAGARSSAARAGA